MRAPQEFSRGRLVAWLLTPLLSVSCAGGLEGSAANAEAPAAASEASGPRAQAESSLATVLVPTGAPWRYRDTGVDLGTAWSATAFDDAGWAEGPAPLGYGETDLATTVSYGSNANSKHITTYLRTHFTVEDASRVSALLVRLQRDDGAIVYLNGVEVFRSNLPTGAVGYRTLASATVSLPAEETIWLEQSVSQAALGTRTNVLAVEVHQSAANTSDMRFDLELSATVAPSPDANPMSVCYPLDMPTTPVLRAARKMVFGFYYPIYPISIENKGPSVDFWSSWLDPAGRNREPGRLVITQGADVRTLDATSAGVTPFSVPLVPGTTPVFELQRNGQTVQRLVSKTPIVAQTVYQDMMYHAGGGRECARP
ncbi:hypothetical protein [Myxococcus sp. Y35]|uniref:hypothetical protein n=1 Tax=Pseudomyxococcus flavus TaxID=3115648 RepID=UPI003CF86555